ncbi:MAG TPA: flagellar hook-associated protein FlgK [Syntrophobacteraceae bacterium]|nr:flagellar hook-associated protein FlgK [Syntrophobacteraceae bacterium]
MPGLTSTLEIAKNTLLNEQLMIQTATNNIANADNKYYARQRVNVVTNPSTSTAAGWIGNGARADAITQIRDQYIDQQLTGSISQQYDYRTRSDQIGIISALLGDNGSVGLSSDLGAFWDAWDALSQNPSGLVEKDGVLAATENLVATIQDAQSSLTSAVQGIDGQITDQVAKINDLLQQIGTYNQRITAYEATGQPANDLRDLRYQALSELSQYLGISYSEQANGAVTVNLTDGATTVNLVTNQNYGQLQYNSTTHLISYTPVGGGTVAPNPNNLSGGSVSGLAYSLKRLLAPAQGGDADSYQVTLDTFTSNLITQVNAAYGAAVFTGTSAATIAVAAGFNNAATINGSAALTVAGLQDTAIAGLSNNTFSQYLSYFQHQIGQDQSAATSRADFYESLASDLQAQQQSVSGVSIDEETVDLLKFQQVYSAAAKIIQRTDEMLKTIIDMV